MCIFCNIYLCLSDSLVYYKIRHKAKTAYSQNTIQTYNIIKSDALHKT